eukprot:jgi/Chlat1/4358/Chrsp29S00350
MSAPARSASRLRARASSSLRAARHRAEAATWQASAAASSSGRQHAQAAGSQSREMSFVSEFMKRVRGGVESNPELKKSVEELREQTEKFKRETSEFAKKAAQATDGVSQRARQAATQVAERLGEAKSQVSSTVRESLSEAEKTETYSRLKETVSAFKPGKAAEQDTSGKPQAQAQAESTQHKAEEAEGSAAGAQGDASTSGSAQESTWQRIRAQPVKQTLTDFFLVVKAELDLLIKPTPPRSSGTYAGPAGASSALVPVRKKESAWQKRWGSFRDQAATNPLFQRLFTINSKVLDRGKGFADDLRDRWETSDSPIVHSIQDMQDKLFGETDTAIAMKEIRRREPEFSLPEFVYQLKTEIAPLLRSYLEGDLDTIKKWCTSEMVSRITSEVMLWKQEGAVPDSSILNVGDVELAAIKLQGGDPHIVVQFACQQINCVRDLHGNITEGAEDDIQSVYYAWALRQDVEEVEEKLSDTGETYTVVKPKWKLRDMAVRAIRATI